MSSLEPCLLSALSQNGYVHCKLVVIYYHVARFLDQLSAYALPRAAGGTSRTNDKYASKQTSSPPPSPTYLPCAARASLGWLTCASDNRFCPLFRQPSLNAEGFEVSSTPPLLICCKRRVACMFSLISLTLLAKPIPAMRE